MTDIDRLDALAAAAARLSREEDRKPAHRGRIITHEVDESHPNTEACDICQLLAAVRERDELRAALIALDGAFQWIESEFPKGLTKMPSSHFAAFFKARAALSAEEARRG